MPEVSVILPIYNSEQWLNRLLSSLLKQTFNDFEIICVDDGSIDNSAEIIKGFMQEDARISYYYQENSGGGAARNLGIERAKGKYLICLDSDDLYEKTLVEDLYTKALKTNADIVICKYKVWNQSTGRISGNKGINMKKVPEKEVFSSKDVDDILHVTNPGPCNKLYRRQFILDNNLKYSTTRIINDLKFSMLALCLADSITTVDKELSTYKYQIAGSGSKNREMKLETSLFVYKEIYEEFLNRGLWENIKKLYFYQVIDSLKFELSFPVSDKVLSSINSFLSEKEPFLSLGTDEITSLFNIKKIKKNYINYFILSVFSFGLNRSAIDKFKQFKNRLENLNKIGLTKMVA